MSEQRYTIGHILQGNQYKIVDTKAEVGSMVMSRHEIVQRLNTLEAQLAAEREAKQHETERAQAAIKRAEQAEQERDEAYTTANNLQVRLERVLEGATKLRNERDNDYRAERDAYMKSYAECVKDRNAASRAAVRIAKCLESATFKNWNADDDAALELAKQYLAKGETT
jgi:hypothetical protein